MVTHAHRALPHRVANTWYKRIRNAQVRGRFLFREVGDAGDWNSCAIGERFNVPVNARGVTIYRIETKGFTTTEANYLLILGDRFANAVTVNDPAEAFRLYNKIHRAKPGQLRFW